MILNDPLLAGSPGVLLMNLAKGLRSPAAFCSPGPGSLRSVSGQPAVSLCQVEVGEDGRPGRAEFLGPTVKKNLPFFLVFDNR